LVILNACAHHHQSTGIVLAVGQGEVTISHREIPGYMPAMAMPFRVRHAADLNGLAPGSRVRFDLRVSRNGTLVTRLRADAGPPADFPIPKPQHPVAIGEAVPDFELIDEQGHPTRLSDYRGRVVAIDFIYTRCPLPDVCPRLSANFALLQKRFAGRGIALLSITIDPDHDTPEVLREYAARWVADPKVWRFLTGATDTIRKVADEFGLVYFAEEGAITHTSSTALIGADGRLVARLEGSSYTTRQVSDLVSQVLAHE